METRPLGSQWSLFGQLWGHNGHPLVDFGVTTVTIWTTLGRLWTNLGTMGGAFGDTLVTFGSIWTTLGDPLHQKNEGQTKAKKKNKKGGPRLPLLEFFGTKK